MVNQETMKADGGAVCLHCGTLRINKGEQCLAVTRKGGAGYIAIAHKDEHPFTKGFVVNPTPQP
jgi:hypothetical protein